MRVGVVTLFAVGIGLCGSAMAAGPRPAGVECGHGRTWWPTIGGCVTLPVLKSKVDPDFPNAVPGLRYGAILHVNVSVAGRVGQVQVLKAPPESAQPEDGESAISALVEAVRLWRFEPGRDPEGNPIAMSVTLKLHLLMEE
jgi:hypothetical protein